MLAAERQKRVLTQLRTQGTANVGELADEFAVSLSTIRRDLRDLQDRGLLARVHGGASTIDGDVEPGRSLRSSQYQSEKRRIGTAAADRVPDGATVLIGGGTTTEAMLEQLALREGVTVVTNNLGVAYELSRFSTLQVVVLGGVLRHHELSLLGHQLTAITEDFHIDLAFTGAFAVDAEYGLFGSDVREVHTDREMLKAADTLVVLADGSKFGRRGPVKLLPVEEIGAVITDPSAPGPQVDILRRRGIEVELA